MRTGSSSGSLVALEGERYYRISDHDRLPPFFVTVVSADDHWLFASSRGGLTAGRRDPDRALFPYTTDDKIHDAAGITGGVSVLFVERGGERVRWEPFAAHASGGHGVERSLYKSVEGDRLVHEERRADLGLTFRAAWCTSRRFGFVRRVTLENHGAEPASVRLVDGIANLLPSGVERRMQTEYSVLVDAYKRSELIPEHRLGVFRLSSIPVDRAEPSEALRATVAWLEGLPGARCLLSTGQLEAFRRGGDVREEQEVRGTRQAFLANAELELAPGAARRWSIVADVDQDAAAIEALLATLDAARRDGGGADLAAELDRDVRRGTEELRRLVASADGLQLSGRPLEDVSHFSNTLFNVMRGGVFVHGYEIPVDDFRAHVRCSSKAVAERCADALEALGAPLDLAALRAFVASRGDDDLARIAREYLPLFFSRRHGDPSRPWNAFSIETRDRDGRPKLAYAGNWRDIFQNWEALCVSFPLFTENVVARFVDASTADGYNPYRLTDRGFDWEVLDRDDPWSNIGYWGDHQIVYLGRLLELAERHLPGTLDGLLARRQFAYADVPYRIRPYAALLADPHETIDYDDAYAAEIGRRVAAEGEEGKLVRDRSGAVHRVGLAEKLLVPALVKVANLVPELGVWMNTQRPEWNDANNALVGWGCSVVTTCQVRRYLQFVGELLRATTAASLPLSREVATLLDALRAALARHAALLAGPLEPADRRAVLDALGAAAEAHRAAVYGGFEGTLVDADPAALASFCDLARSWIEHTIRANRRADGLYHAYNLLELRPDGGVDVRRLDVMLEGQVAVLSAGMLAPAETLEVLEALRASDLYCPEQHSYLLYPDRPRPRFLERNRIPDERIRPGGLVRALLDAGDERVVVAGPGGVRFAPGLRNAAVLARVLDELAGESPRGAWSDLVARDRADVLAGYEEVFQHRAFTGRSGSFYGYEGLGCVYWHQVSKLVLAAFEALRDAVEEGVDDELFRALAARYADVRAGLGTHKSPAEHGAFPTDPYSHTPRHAGARQPGMTGQVKEDILSRLGELGVWTAGGRLRFRPVLLDPADWRPVPATFRYVALDGTERELALAVDSLALTLCQVPVVLVRSDVSEIRVLFSDGAARTIPCHELDVDTSTEIFRRTGCVESLQVRWSRD